MVIRLVYNTCNVYVVRTAMRMAHGKLAKSEIHKNQFSTCLAKKSLGREERGRREGGGERE